MTSDIDISLAPSMEAESSDASSEDTFTSAVDEQAAGEPTGSGSGLGTSTEDSLPAFLKLSRGGKRSRFEGIMGPS
jgi:hypothetical protein